MTLAAILAGGRATRFDGADKGDLRLAGKPLIAHVAARLGRQTDRIVIAGPASPHFGAPAIPDAPDAPAGPAGAVFSVAAWCARHAPEAQGFATAPVDGPFLPADLISRLQNGGESAIAFDGRRAHPTFAWWRLADLSSAKEKLESKSSVSLHDLADACNARRVRWREPGFFFNINTPRDLEAAETMMREAERGAKDA